MQVKRPFESSDMGLDVQGGNVPKVVYLSGYLKLLEKPRCSYCEKSGAQCHVS